jgi:hypothetical protein
MSKVTMMCVNVVRYKGEYYIHYNDTDNGSAKLITPEGKKFSGTPTLEKLEYIRSIQCKHFNGSMYFNTKIGVFSAATGKKIVHPKIVGMFN